MRGGVSDEFDREAGLSRCIGEPLISSDKYVTVGFLFATLQSGGQLQRIGGAQGVSFEQPACLRCHTG